MFLLFKSFNLDTHVTCSTSNNTHCSFYIVGIQVWHFVLSNFF